MGVLRKNMTNTILEKYIKEFVQNNKQEKTQITVFWEFVSSVIFDGSEFTIEDFALLNVNELKESLEYYIRRNKITAKQTANTYVGNLKRFFFNLENHYQVHNDVYINRDFIPAFWEEIDSIIFKLNDTVNTGTATDDEYESLVSKIDHAENQYSYDEAVLEIDNYVEDSSNNRLDGFHHILSVCASRLVIEYGMSNRVIRSIKTNDVDLENSIIIRGRYSLPISTELKRSLVDYVKLREYLLNKLNKTQELFFIQCSGEGINDRGASDQLFTKVVGENSSKESKPYAKRCIERMVKEGFSSNIIKEITGYSDSVYKAVCNFVDNENSTQAKLIEFITPSNRIKVQKKGYINCPVCAKEIKATSENLVLIKKPESDVFYLCCKECGEKEKEKARRNFDE